jgi:hypothetical protein
LASLLSLAGIAATGSAVTPPMNFSCFLSAISMQSRGWVGQGRKGQKNCLERRFGWLLGFQLVAG